MHVISLMVIALHYFLCVGHYVVPPLNGIEQLLSTQGYARYSDVLY